MGVIRVLHVVRGMNLGGAETFIMNVYRKIDRNKVQFDFLVSRDGEYDEEIKKLGGKIYKTKYLTDVGPFMYKRILKKFFNEHKEYEIIHSHVDKTTGIILEVASKCGIKYRISHSHSSGSSNNKLIVLYKDYLGNKIIKYATNLFACSDEAARWLFKSRSDEAVVINNGIDFNKFSYNDNKREKIRSKYNIEDNTLVIGHVGRMEKVKNHKFLLELFSLYNAKNQNSILLLIGDGSLRSELEEYSKGLNIDDKVIFVGNTLDVNEYYNAMDIFVFPSLYEGLPFTLIESQVNGLPVIASNNIDKKVKFNENFVFESLDNVDEWLINLNKLIRITNISNDLDKYNIDKVVKKLEEFYKGLK